MGALWAFAKGLNWIRILLIAGMAVAIFGMGYMYAGQKHAEHEADVQKQITAAVVAKEKELREEFRLRLADEEAARLSLQTDLASIRDHRDSLIEEIRRTALTKPVSEIVPEGCLESDDENVQIVLANPFTDDFVRLWNDASRGRLPGTNTDTETD